MTSSWSRSTCHYSGVPGVRSHESHVVLDHRQLDCSFRRLFRPVTTKTAKRLSIAGPLWLESIDGLKGPVMPKAFLSLNWYKLFVHVCISTVFVCEFCHVFLLFVNFVKNWFLNKQKMFYLIIMHDTCFLFAYPYLTWIKSSQATWNRCIQLSMLTILNHFRFLWKLVYLPLKHLIYGGPL